MRAFDFHDNELDHLYRTALQIQARNLRIWRTWRRKDHQKTGEERYKPFHEAALLASLALRG